MTDEQQAKLDAFNDWAEKFRAAEALQKLAQDARESERAAWGLLQAMGRREGEAPGR